MILATLALLDGDKRQAAQSLGISLKTLWPPASTRTARVDSPACRRRGCCLHREKHSIPLASCDPPKEGSRRAALDCAHLLAMSGMVSTIESAYEGKTRNLSSLRH
ncbi:hypothetical protein ACU4GD_24280 [Cupriavidus basilensis]